MAYRPRVAVRRARKEVAQASMDWTGWCLKFVRMMFGIDALEPSAAKAWQNAKHKHRVTDPMKIPFGKPIFWLGGSQGFGHIAISIGNGRCISTDIFGAGRVFVCDIAEIERRWGMKFVGYTDDLNGVMIPSGPTWKPGEYPGKAVFRIGKTHPAIKMLGNRLVRAGYGDAYEIGPSPEFGRADKVAVRRFRRDHGMPGIGGVTKQVWERLERAQSAPQPKPDPKPQPEPEPAPEPSQVVSRARFLKEVERRKTAEAMVAALLGDVQDVLNNYIEEDK